MSTGELVSAGARGSPAVGDVEAAVRERFLSNDALLVAPKMLLKLAPLLCFLVSYCPLASLCFSSAQAIHSACRCIC